MEINLFQDYELTDDFFEHYKLDDVLLFSYAEPGAQGFSGNIEAVVKIDDNEIGVFSGSYMWSNPKLTEAKVVNFFFPITMEDLNKTDWDRLNMGMGNRLFVRKQYSNDYKKKYDKLIEEVPYILYETWREFTNYYLNVIYNNIDDRKLIKDVNDNISVICDQFSIKNNNVDFNLYGKFVKVLCKDGSVISGVFSDDFEDDNEIAVGSTLINYDDIEKMEEYYTDEEQHIKLFISQEDIDFLQSMDIKITSDIVEIIEQIEDCLQTKGLADDGVNEIGKHCEDILDKLDDVDCLDDTELYTYVSVVYDDDIVGKIIENSFYYKTNIEDISVGDKVLVDRQGKQVKAEVVHIEYREKDNVPYPLEKTKDIIKVLKTDSGSSHTTDDDCC